MQTKKVSSQVAWSERETKLRSAKRSAAAVVATLAALLIFCSSYTATPAELKHKPWIEKDWTQWSATDCEYVRRYSPWADYDGHETAPSVSANGQTAHYWAQLLSSLPMREANLRELQIAKSYSRMNAAKKQAFDQEHSADLAENVNDPVRIWMGQLLTDTAAVREGYAVPPPVFQAALKLSDGTIVTPIEILAGGLAMYQKGGVTYVFSRTVKGQPLYSTNDKNLTIVFGCALTFKERFVRVAGQDLPPFRANCGGPRADEFPIAPMIYNGKLEY
jgi:hypothetical protein